MLISSVFCSWICNSLKSFISLCWPIVCVYCSCDKCVDVLYRAEISAILAYFGRPCSPENSDSIFEFAHPKRLFFTRNISRYVVQNWNQCNFSLFSPKLGCHATALAPLKIQIAYLNSPTPKGCYSREKFLDMLYRTEISAILAYFCPNLVAMATALAPLKIQIAYLNSPTPKTLPYMQEVSRYVVQSWN